MEKSKYGHRTINWFEAIVNKLGGEEGAERFLRNELVVSEPARSWREKDGIIYFSVISNGLSGEQEIKHLEKLGHKVGDYAKSVLRSKDYKPSKKGTVHKIAVLKGELFLDESRVTRNIRMEAEKMKMTKPNAEVACLIREKFTNKEIEETGLNWIVIMHEPIKDSGGYLSLLGTSTRDSFSGLDAYYGIPGSRWGREYGFAFVAPQVVLGT